MGTDEESKRQARSDRDRSRNDDHHRRLERDHRSGGGESSSSEKKRTTQRSGSTTPGAYSANSTDEYSRYASRKVRRSENNDRQRETSTHRDGRDRDAKRSARHTSHSPTRPGAHRSDHHTSRSPTRPGAHRSNQRPSDGKTISRSPNRNRKSRSPTKDDGLALIKSSPNTILDQEQSSTGATHNAVIDGGEVVAQVISVEDNDGTDKKDDDVERMAEENREFRERLKQENEHRRIKMKEENERRQLEFVENMKREQEQEQQEEKKRHRRQCVIIVVLLVLISVGVGVFFGVQGSSSQTSTNAEKPNNDPSLVPVTDGGGGNTTIPATPTPTIAPTNAPVEPLKYPPPDLQDCQNVAIGLPRDVPDDNDDVDLITSNYQVILEVESSSSSPTDFQNLVSNFETKIQRILVTELVGCNDDTATRRRRRRSLLRRHHQRKLQGGDTRYVIFDANTAVRVAEEKTCQDNASPNCHVVEVNLDVFLHQELGFFINSMIFDVFDTDQDPDHTSLASKLELESSQYPSVSLTNILRLNPTASPPTNPTSIPSASPSTGRPSAIPTDVPSVNPSNPPSPRPTTPQPTLNPTRRPNTPPPFLIPLVNDDDDNDDDCEDIPSFFESGEYAEYEGGDDAIYTIPCGDLKGTNVIGLSVDKDDCGFTCVADKRPQQIEPKCAGGPPGTTVKIRLKGNHIGERIFIGVQPDGAEKLQCNGPFLVEEEDEDF